LVSGLFAERKGWGRMMPERKPIRLKGYDYSTPGAYFITVCAHNRFENRNIFGSIHNSEMMKNRWAAVVESCWCDLPNHYVHISLDEFIVMPDHFHGIVWINNIPVGNGHARSLRRQNETLPNVVGSFKSAVSRNIHQNDFPDFQWQKSYYDHVIRNDESMQKIREYVQNNPRKWELDHDDNETNDIMNIIGHVGNRHACSLHGR
jgi:REP element-mobilizing transposase RayT